MMSVKHLANQSVVLSFTYTLSAEETLASTGVKGFPIVASKSSKALSGYIGRTELRYVLGIFFDTALVLRTMILPEFRQGAAQG